MALLRHLAIRCDDMEKSRKFYETVIGLKFIDYRANHEALDMSDGTSNITLIQQPADCRRPTLEEGNEYLHFGIIVDDVQGCWDRCREWGAELSKDSIKQAAGVGDPNRAPERSFKVLDPDGNVVDVTVAHDEWRGVRI